MQIDRFRKTDGPLLLVKRREGALMKKDVFGMIDEVKPILPPQGLG
ncbi:MAG: hypothetical protein NPIRA03_20290 [Nitrospirales bacterium]|nr:MAG: hypothetical protein NPIRA03_20290 [Nitrospirales bacterium]